MAQPIKFSGETSAAARTGGKVFVDVSEEPTQAQISRGGFHVAEIAVNDEVITSYIDVRPVTRTRVVRQSITPGTAVAHGTAIDIVLVDAGGLSLQAIPGVHVALAESTMSEVYEQYNVLPQVREIMRRRSNPEELTAQERETLTGAFETAGVPITTENPVDFAFTGVKAAFTFMG